MEWNDNLTFKDFSAILEQYRDGKIQIKDAWFLLGFGTEDESDPKSKSEPKILKFGDDVNWTPTAKRLLDGGRLAPNERLFINDLLNKAADGKYMLSAKQRGWFEKIKSECGA
jgi:hypothetical protein